jgi:biopolymer transport protein TolR
VRHSQNSEDYEISGINVTPLVDIMLVLLIIFLVTATYIVREAIRIDLPRTVAAGTRTPRTLSIVVAKDGQAYIDGDGVAANDARIAGAVADWRKKSQDVQAVISADRDARHGAVVHILDLLKREGVSQLAIEVEKESERGR